MGNKEPQIHSALRICNIAIEYPPLLLLNYYMAGRSAGPKVLLNFLAI